MANTFTLHFANESWYITRTNSTHQSGLNFSKDNPDPYVLEDYDTVREITIHSIIKNDEENIRKIREAIALIKLDSLREAYAIRFKDYEAALKNSTELNSAYESQMSWGLDPDEKPVSVFDCNEAFRVFRTQLMHILELPDAVVQTIKTHHIGAKRFFSVNRIHTVCFDDNNTTLTKQEYFELLNNQN